MNMVNMINADAIASEYEKIVKERKQTNYFQVDIKVVDETGSTNADLLQQSQFIEKPTLLIAKNQTAGRGRAGRVWYSKKDDVLTFSLAWRFRKNAQELMGITLAIGVALTEVLNQLGVKIQLKWPNDLLKEGKKIAGILVETTKLDAETSCVIIGVGLNLHISSELENKIGQAVADSAWLAQMEKNMLIAQLLYSLTQAMQTFQENGFEAFQEKWNYWNAHANQVVDILDNGEILYTGKVSGVDRQGFLILQTEKGEVRVHTGDVSLRLTSSNN